MGEQHLIGKPNRQTETCHFCTQVAGCVCILDQHTTHEAQATQRLCMHPLTFGCLCRDTLLQIYPGSVPDFTKYLDDMKKYLNGTVNTLNPIIKDLFNDPGFPTFTINISKPEIPTFSINLPQPNVDLTEVIPTMDLGKLQQAIGKNGVKTFNLSSLGLHDAQTLESLLKAFKLQKGSDSSNDTAKQ